ncbi:MAG TPA: Rne/Rng family ribonuclease [Isosphaeraceae bacterium]|jgi:ribonuclease E|nr:Rne/Rng family ribonuclease [Isosphaeraceae bacterium]
MKKEMLINVLQPEECRIAIVEDGVLEELYVERTSHESYTGNIYKGRVVNLEPAIQAAFVDFSVGRNGFLHVSDVEPQYYRRHLGDDTELSPRDKNRDPRRERDEPRPPRGEERGHRDRGPAPPTALPEERPRERERPERPPERERPERPERPPGRERPDLSERGRRDRSEPRRFGEGLTDDDDWSPPPLPSSRAVEPPPSAEPERTVPDDLQGGPTELSARMWQEEPPSFPASARPEVDEEPRGRLPRPVEPYDPDLPPSRTHRGQSVLPHRGAEPPELGRGPAWTAPEERGAAPEIIPPAPGPRKGRGRGRPPRPVPEPVTEPVLPFEPEPEPEVGLAAPDASIEPEEPIADEPPRRRAGRAAIRSRGGDREAPAQPARARAVPPESAGESEPERPRPPRTRDRDAARGRGPEPEAPRERGRAHGRAGEPGYVPRRERTRPPEPSLEAGIEPAPTSWPDLDVPRAEEDVDREPGAEPEASELPSAAGKLEGPKRRRRRRGRRRERPLHEPAGPGAPDEDLEPEDAEGFVEVRSTRELSGVAREEPPPLDDDFDFGDGVDEDVAAVEVIEVGASVGVEEEIDPELEEEIRKEIEEIAELEREMGLRGPIEARPHRGDERAVEPGGRGGPRAPRGRGMAKPPIQEIFRRGDEVLIQVIKESIGTKGPTLSTYISIPGRYLVLMPGLNRVGVSRKIADEGQRRKLREIMNELNPPKGLGFIVRTAGLERSKRELARDLAYLLRLWKVILRRIKKTRAPAPIYQESDMITRTIRDIFTAEIDTIWIDEPQAFERAQEFLRVVMPKYVNRLKFYDEKVPLFHKYGIEDEIAKIQRRHIPLPEGGSIVIDQTEALVAIDVNSGNFRVENDAERTAYEMNLRAAKEIARQLRLRDLGGVIVNDFIDMREERNRRGVERALRDAIKRDRARTKILRMSAFGIIEMTRQRIRPSLRRSVYEDCTHCTGSGVVKTAESMAIDVMRLLALAAHREDIRRINVSVCAAVSNYLNNRKRREIARLETEASMTIHIRHEEDTPAEHLQIDCYDSQNNEVRLLPQPAPPSRRSR